MKLIDLQEFTKFGSDKPFRELLFDSPNLRVLSFNLEPGQEMPVHSHPGDSELVILILEGEGVFTGGSQDVSALAGKMQIMSVGQPHGLKAKTRLRLLVFIAPTI